MLDPTTGLHTEINERGPAVSPQEMELFREKLLYLAKGASICVFAGSLPRGVEPDVYASLIREVRKLGVTTMIDTDGEPLRLAMRAEPDVVSPNELEAEELVGHEFNDVDDRAQAVVEMTRLGAHEAIMTVPDGCYAQVLEGGVPALYRVRIEEQEARSPVGSGDAFLAGYVAARYAGRSPVECLRFGVACGAESTQHFGAGILEPAKVDRLLDEVDARAGPDRLPRSAESRVPRPGRPERPLLASTDRRLPPSVPCCVRMLCRTADGWLPPLDRPVRPDRLGCCDGSRDRTRKEGPAGLWIRRHRDRPVAAHARPRRRRHLVDARPLPVRSAAARGGAGRRRLARDRRR